MQLCLSFLPFQLTLLPAPPCKNHESQAQVHTWTCPCTQENAREWLYNSHGNEEQMEVKGALFLCLGLALSVGPLHMPLDQCQSRGLLQQRHRAQGEDLLVPEQGPMQPAGSSMPTKVP